MIKVTLTSKKTKRIVERLLTPQQLLNNYSDELDLVDRMTECDCQPVGETCFLDCNCYEEWEEFRIDFEENV